MKNITYIHEHIKIDLSGVKKDDDCKLDCYNETVAELKKLKELGVSRIVEVTNIGMGRDVSYMQKVKNETGVDIIMSTGFYKEPFLPKYFYDKTENELAEILISDIKDGMDGTSFKASVIGEAGTSNKQITAPELKLLNACVLAHKQTSAPLSTHTTLGTMAIEQGDFFLSKNVDPERVYIGHTDLSKNVETIASLASKGFYCGFDTVGKNNYFPDEDRVVILKELEKRGLIHKIMLSMDITRKSHLKAFGGLSYSHLLETFVPMLRKGGILESSIERMLIENPKAYLGK